MNRRVINLPFNQVRDVEIDVFVPFLRQQVSALLLQRGVSLCNKEIKVLNPAPSSRLDKGQTNCDRFLLIIPYAGECVQLLVVFQSSEPNCPPDFIFGDGVFYAPLHEIKSYCSWNIKKSDAFLCCLKEIMQVYKKRHIYALERYEHLSFEYLCLYQVQGFSEDDIEVIVPYISERPVVFLIKLHVNFDALFPDYCRKVSRKQEYPLLLVTFPNRESSRSYQRLYLPSQMETVLGIDNQFKIPAHSTDNHLARYVITLENKIKTKLELASIRLSRRKLYFLKFLSYYESSIVEYDIEDYHTMVLLLNEDDYYVVVEINMPDEYPAISPALVFRSVYHKFMGKPCATAVDSYPYSRHWPIEQVLLETAKFIKSYIEEFKTESVKYQSKFEPISSGEENEPNAKHED